MVHACLAHRVLREARVQAFQRHTVNGFRGGLVVDDADAKLRHRRHDAPCDSPSQAAEYPNRISGEFVYGGPIVTHFGHFMAETVHRLVPSRLLHGEAPFVFVSEAGPRAITSFSALPGFARDVLQLLGLKAGTVRLIGENTVVEQLFAVEQGSEWGFGPKPGYLDDLRDYVTPRLDELYRSIRRPAKIYVSRARMPGGKFLGEQYLEEQLAAEGFAIVHPETLPVTVQMDLYRKADVLVFPDGSACHGVELLGTGALGRCCLLVRRKSGAEIFEKVLKPRAAEFIASAGHPFIGTKFMHPITQQPLTRLGVSLFNPRELVSCLRQGSIARLPNFVEREYFRAAEHDLLRYQREIPLPGPVGRWIRRLAGKRRGPPIRPGAQSALNASFRKHAVVERGADLLVETSRKHFQWWMTMTTTADPADVTGFWTGQDPKAWFTADPGFDAEVTRRFKGLLEQARSGALDAWSETPEGTLALVILLDQMSRNVYRGRPEMYGGDAKALGLAKHAIGRGFDQRLPAEQRRWLYMPFMHSEDLADQEAGVDLFRRAGLDDNVPYAIEHADIIRRFGRFPHRNAILGRDSTPEEEAFLADGGFAG